LLLIVHVLEEYDQQWSGYRSSDLVASAGTTEKSSSKVFPAPRTRHARRLYFGKPITYDGSTLVSDLNIICYVLGGILAHCADENALKSYLNDAINEGLGLPKESDHIPSVHLDARKGYALVEFISIELTTACLELDGCIFGGAPLKVGRAKEYRPEMVATLASPLLKVWT